MQDAETVHRAARGLFHGLADLVGHRIQPFVDGARHFRLTSHQRLTHFRDTAGGFVLHAQDFGEPFLQFVGAYRLRHGGLRTLAARAGDDDGDSQQQQQRQRAECDQGGAHANRHIAGHEKDLVHAAFVARFVAKCERIGNVLWLTTP